MSPVSRQLGLLALAASAVVAAPGHARHHHHHSGRPVIPSGSGAPYGYGNGTGPYGTGSGLATGFATSTVSAVAQTETVTSYAYVTAAAPATNLAAAAVSDDTCSSAATVTMTNTVTVTETATGGLTLHAAQHKHSHSFGPAPAPSSSSEAETTTTTSSSSSSSSVVLAVSTSPSSSSSSSSSTIATSASSTAAAATTSSSSSSIYVAPTTSTSVASSSTVVSSSSSSSSSAAATTSATATGGKRGCAYNIASYCDTLASDELTWSYNWAYTNGDWGFATDDVNSTLNYVPMIKDATVDSATWTSAANAAISSGATHIMTFNEPDNAGQADMSVAAAVSAWATYVKPFEGGSVKIGAPAVSNSQASGAGLEWLASFLQECTDCQIDFIPIHWYGDSSEWDLFTGQVESAISQFIDGGSYGKLWVTEIGLVTSGDYACASQSPTESATLVSNVTSYLDGNPSVERYSFFMADENCLLNSGATAPSEAGSNYMVAASS